MPAHHKINYVEFTSPQPEITRSFFGQVFGWRFEEFDDYLAFHDAGLDGGIICADPPHQVEKGGPLIVFYSLDIKASEQLVCRHGAKIVTPCFSFPGGRRFHFTEPAGNEFAIWSDR